jgi:hypothetical protein
VSVNGSSVRFGWVALGFTTEVGCLRAIPKRRLDSATFEILNSLRMVALTFVALSVIGIYTAGTVVKVLYDELVLHKSENITSLKHINENRSFFDNQNVVELLINGKPLSFAKDTTNPNNHYELAIEFCSRHG